ncbi:MAG: ACP S-malonyltransferase [Prochloron sp. SP5CPC1]|nr:ACP S-malonyltransferase [Candidatus Paraprochloron terpiosi SP5CPC1]
MTKTAWVFPGQGSQAVGMGVDLKDIPTARTKLETASEILGWSILDICQGEEETLSRTLYTQPCLYTIESILADLLVARVGLPNLLAGHSLGEYVALYTAGVFDFESGLRLVKRRAELMDTAAGGKMAALMKFDRQQLEKSLEKTPGVVLANDNSAAQVVISGTPEAVDTILSQVKARKQVTLKVGGAFHSPLMEKAATEFEAVLKLVNFVNAKIPLLSNVNPSAQINGAELKQRLIQQMTGTVRWREIMLELPKEEITAVVEVGPGKVLTGLLKRTYPEVNLNNISRFEDINNFQQK